MSFKIALSIDTFPFVLTNGEVTLPSTADSTKWEPAEDMPNGCGQASALEFSQLSWSEMCAPVEGTLDVSMLSFSLHDTIVSYGGSDVRIGSFLLGRDPTSIQSTVLLRSASLGALELEIPTGASSALTSGYPKVLYVGDEAILCDSYSGGIITVNANGRGYYGSRARNYNYRPDLALYPEIFAEPPYVEGRRCILWAIENGIAYAIWRGVISRGPELRGGKWVLSADHIWTVEKNRVLGDPSITTRVVGFEPSAINIGIDCQNAYGGGTFDAGVRTWYGWNAAGSTPLGDDQSNGNAYENADLFCDFLQRTLAARMAATTLASGASHTPQTQIAVRVERAGSQVSFSVRCADTGNQPSLVVRMFTKETRGGTKDEGGGVYSGTLTFDLPPVALTFERGKENIIPLDYAIDLTIRPTTGNDRASEVPIVKTWLDGAFRTSSRVLLVGDYDEQTRFVVYPTLFESGSAITGRVDYITRDGTPARSSLTDTFAGYGNNTVARVYYGGERGFGANPTLFLDRSVRLVLAQWVTCDHWIYGLKHALEDAAIATESDARNWDWSTADTVARITAHELTAREWYLDGSMRMGDLIGGTLVLDGCGVVVRSGGRLGITAVRQPLAHWSQGYESSAIAATITEDDLIQGSVPTWRKLNDALISAAKIVAADTVIVPDQRSRQKWGQRRTVELAVSGIPLAKQGGADARALQQRVLHRVMGLWAEPRYEVSFQVKIPFLFGSGAVYGGDFVKLTAWNIPDGVGGRGVTEALVYILGREPNLNAGSITLRGIVFPVAYGYAPCIKINDLTNGYPGAGKCTLSAGTHYVNAGAADETDYAGAGGTDLGVGWFKAGDKVALYLRDSTLGVREVSLTVESVDVASGSLVVTPEVPLVPFDWDAAVIGGEWVDLTYDAATVQTDAGQKSFAYVGSGNAGDGTIAFSGDTQRSRRFAT